MLTPSSSSEGIILFAHGSRDPLWHKPMQAVAQRITELEPRAHVRCAYLELTTPDLASTALELVDLGVTLITIVPMFLGVGRHAREDLPALVSELKAKYPSIQIQLKPSVGENPQLIEQLALIALSRS